MSRFAQRRLPALYCRVCNHARPGRLRAHVSGCRWKRFGRGVIDRSGRAPRQIGRGCGDANAGHDGVQDCLELEGVRLGEGRERGLDAVVPDVDDAAPENLAHGGVLEAGRVELQDLRERERAAERVRDAGEALGAEVDEAVDVVAVRANLAEHGVQHVDVDGVDRGRDDAVRDTGREVQPVGLEGGVRRLHAQEVEHLLHAQARVDREALLVDPVREGAVVRGRRVLDRLHEVAQAQAPVRPGGLAVARGVLQRLVGARDDGGHVLGEGLGRLHAGEDADEVGLEKFAGLDICTNNFVVLILVPLFCTSNTICTQRQSDCR